MLEDALKVRGIDIQAAVTRSVDKPLPPHSISPTGENASVPLKQTATPPHDKGDHVVQNLSSALKGAFVTDESLSFAVDGEPRYFGSISGRPELSRINGKKPLPV